MKKFANACVRIMNRWLPDPFLFAIILTIVVFIAAMIGTRMGPIELIWAWGGQGDTKLGMWNLLAFSMQMALVLVLGSALASAAICKKILSAIAGLAKDKKSAIIVVCVVSTICCWLNWGFGLIVGALLAKEVTRRVRDVDYPLIIAAAYSGFVVWHAGLSGSIPLALNAKDGYVIATTGQAFKAATSATIFHPMNLVMCLLVLVGLPILFITMHPDKDRTVLVNPAVLADEEERKYTVETPAEKIEHSKILWGIVCIMGFIYIVYYFIQRGFSLDLNIVNCIFLFLGLLAHGNLRKYVDAIGEAAGGAAGILLQFPFYAGIMGLMTVKNGDVCLAGIISDFFVRISNDVTFPLWTFLSAGVVNFFVPSGGGQWAVQGPIVMPASADLNVEAGRAAMAIAWGDQWTNMIQPFWALPALGVAGLKAKDIMGYLVVVLLFTGIVAILGFLLWGLLF